MENDVKVLKEFIQVSFVLVKVSRQIALKVSAKFGKGGACCSYVANKPKSISIDLNRN